MKYILALLLCLPTFGIEKSLLGVPLGINYTVAKASLMQSYGIPVKSSDKNPAYDAFQLEKGTDKLLIISSSAQNPEYVTAIQVSGSQPIKGLDFISGVNMGHKEEGLPFLLGQIVSEPSSDGYTLHKLPYSNFSIETKNHLVTSIRIGLTNALPVTLPGQEHLTVLSILEGQLMTQKATTGKLTTQLLAQAAKDPLLGSCDRYPIRNDQTSFLVEVSLVGQSKKPVPATFLIDTGWTYIAITPELCQKMGCKVTGTDKYRGKPRQNTTEAAIAVGKEIVTFKKLSLFNPKELGLKVDGILGTEFLLAKEMVLNLKHEYLCFPRKPLGFLAKEKGLAKVKAEYAGTIKVDLTANGKPLKGYYLDTGTEQTALKKQDIQLLKLKSLGKQKRQTVNGTFETELFGPVTVGWPEGLVNLERVGTAPTETPKVGIDLLQEFAIGLDEKAKSVYLFP